MYLPTASDAALRAYIPERTLFIGPKHRSADSFCAWLALREQGIVFRERVDDRSAAGEAPFRPLPVLLEEDGTAIFDAPAIMEYASDCGGRSLMPADPRLRARVRSFIGWQCRSAVGMCKSAAYANAFSPSPHELAMECMREAARFFALIESHLAVSRGPHLFGALSLADLALVPTIFRIVYACPDMAMWPRTQAWADRLLGRCCVREWLVDAARSAASSTETRKNG
jgi:glutathione S-transferase